MRNKSVTLCGCVSRSFIAKEKVAQVAAILRNGGYEVRVIPDLCELVMEKSPVMTEVASSVILACYPRAVRSLLETMSLTPELLLDMRNSSVQEITSQLLPDSSPENPTTEETDAIRQPERFTVKKGVDAWYPVVDKERCIACGKCYDFCLFGVYSLENKQVKVTQPQNCKNNCPACARVCPSQAIMFPKYEKSPINGGLVSEEQFDPGEMDVLYRERLRYRLQQRRASVPLIKGDVDK